MNTNLLTILKKIISTQGEDILSDPKRMKAIFSDLARDEPKPDRIAFGRCVEHGFVQMLKNTAEPERDNCKQQLAQKLHDEEGLDPALCRETLELLAAVLFGEAQKKNYCKNCGKELREEWKTCPYCLTPEVKTSQVIAPAVSSGAGSGGYGVEQITPETITPSNDTAKITDKCTSCHWLNNGTGICTYLGNDKKILFQFPTGNCPIAKPVEVPKPAAVPKKPAAAPPEPEKKSSSLGSTIFWIIIFLIILNWGKVWSFLKSLF